MQSTLRRGWYFGNQAFCDCLLKLADGALKKKAKNHNYRGEELRDHGEKRAKAIMTKGLRLTGLKRVDLDSVSKNDPRKVLIALAIRQEIGMSLKWIADKLRM